MISNCMSSKSSCIDVYRSTEVYITTYRSIQCCIQKYTELYTEDKNALSCHERDSFCHPVTMTATVPVKLDAARELLLLVVVEREGGRDGGREGGREGGRDKCETMIIMW